MAMTPQMLAQLALKNPELLASLLAARGVQPSQVLGGQGTTALAGNVGNDLLKPQGGQPMATMPGPTTGPAATLLQGGAPPGVPNAQQIAGLSGGAGAPQPQIPLGDILAGVRPPAITTAPRPGGAAPQQAGFNPNVLALMQWLAQNGAGGQGGAPTVAPSLGQLLGR